MFDYYNDDEWDGKQPQALTNTITGERLMRCKHCKHAEDTAKLWKTTCSHGRHEFSELYVSIKDNAIVEVK